MSSFKSSAIVVTNKASTVTPTISGDLSIVARNDHLQVFNGTTEHQLIYTSEVGSISGSLNNLISNEVTNRTNADFLLTPLTTTASISGGLNTRLTTVENNYATKATPVSGTYNNVVVNSQGIVTSGGNVGYALSSDLGATYVPYTGASSNVDLGTKTLTADALVLNQSPVTLVAPGQISWNSSDKTFDMGLTSEVTLQVGQESLTRVYNGTALTITNGQPVYITGITNDNPSVALASAVGSFGADPATACAGIATESIAPSGTGFITNKGKVRGLNTSGYTTGQTIYLGETAGTFTAQTSGFAYASHINPLGYVGLVDAISGSVYVDVRDNESSLLSLSERETNVLLGNSVSTGVYEYTGMTIATSASFTIPPLKGWIVDNTGVYATQPHVASVIYGGETFPVTNLATQLFTHIIIDGNNNVTQLATIPTPQQRRENIYLGKLLHIQHSLTAIVNSADYDTSPFSALRDMFSPIAIMNEGVTIYPDGANLTYNKSAGAIYGLGINWTNNQKSPNKIDILATTPVPSMIYVTQTAPIVQSNVIIPGNYDVGGVVTAIGGSSNESSNQRIYQTVQGNIVVQYGQKRYSKLSDAVAGIQSETFVKFPGIVGSSVLIGVLSVWKSASALNNVAHGIFTPASIFGESTGGTAGISTTTLQNAYDNSIQPEIITNSTLGAITIRNGSGINTDNIFELQNSSGLNVLTADGLGNLNVYSISGSSRLGISDYAGFLPSAATIHASKNTNTGVVLDTYSNVGAFAGLTLRNARGTNSTATATQSGDTLGFLGASGHTGSAFSTTSRANMYLQASQTWSTSANGTKISFRTTPNGTIVPVERFLLDHDGSVTIANISGASGSIVTHDATGKLLDSGILATSLASTSTVASISGSLLININTRALDSNVVHTTGAESIGGAKTFTSDITCPGLTANGNIVGNKASAHYVFSNSGPCRAQFGSVEDSAGFVGTQTYHPFIFQTNDTSRGLIDGDGNWVIGTDLGGGELLRVGGTAKVVNLQALTSVSVNGGYAQESGDLGVARSDSTGKIFFGTSEQNSIFFDGYGFIMSRGISATDITLSSLVGTNGSIVTHDATGKLLDSGVLLTDLATNSTVASISGGLDARITSNTNNISSISGSLSNYTLLSTTSSISGNLQSQINSINISGGNYVTLTGNQTISGQKTFTSSMVISAISGNGILLDTTAPTFGWRDITGQIVPDTGATAPNKNVFRGGTIGMYSFAAGDQADIPFHVPHDWVPGTDIYAHVHWSHNGTSIAGNAVFTITATTAKGFNQAIFPAEKSQTITYNTTNIATTPRYIHRVDEIQLSNNGGTGKFINTNDIEVDGLILLNVTMTTLPTIGGGSPNEVFIFQVDLHYQSTNLSTKNKAPSFYPG